MKSLSALIVVHNEEKQLKKCLQTLKFANEIVVILDKCTDKSKTIAQKFSNKIFQGSWDVEGERRNFGIEKCSGDWILEIDADERIPKKLQKEILSITQNSRSDWHPINVENYFGERVVRYGWGCYIGKSSYAGLFKKNSKVWGLQRVHPKIFLTGKKGVILKNKISHFYCKSVFDLFDKLDSYSTARALDLKNNKIEESLFKNIRRIFSRFWKCFITRKGYKEKELGLAIAIVASLYPLLSYLKFKIELSND